MAPISWTGLGCYKEDGPAQNQVLLVPLILHLLLLHHVGLPFWNTNVIMFCGDTMKYGGQVISFDVTLPHCGYPVPQINRRPLLGEADEKITTKIRFNPNS